MWILIVYCISAMETAGTKPLGTTLRSHTISRPSRSFKISSFTARCCARLCRRASKPCRSSSFA